MVMTPSVTGFDPRGPGLGGAIRPDHHPRGIFLLCDFLASFRLARAQGSAAHDRSLGSSALLAGRLGEGVTSHHLRLPPANFSGCCGESSLLLAHFRPWATHVTQISPYVPRCSALRAISEVSGNSGTTCGASAVVNNEQESCRGEILRSIVELGFWANRIGQGAGRCIHESAHSARGVSRL